MKTSISKKEKQISFNYIDIHINIYLISRLLSHIWACIPFIDEKPKYKWEKNNIKANQKKKKITSKLYVYVYCHLHCCFKLQTKTKKKSIKSTWRVFYSKLLLTNQKIREKKLPTKTKLSTYLPIMIN